MDKYIEKIALYLEELLPLPEQADLEQHLSTCTRCQMELDALTRVDHLFKNAPMPTPSPDFVAQFEVRLNRRINKRKTRFGILVISLILILATGLLGWTIADSSFVLLNLFNNFDLLNVLLNLFATTLNGLTTLFNLGILLFGAATQILKQPVFWGYVALTTGILALWTQMLRRFNVIEHPVTSILNLTSG